MKLSHSHKVMKFAYYHRKEIKAKQLTYFFLSKSSHDFFHEFLKKMVDASLANIGLECNWLKQTVL